MNNNNARYVVSSNVCVLVEAMALIMLRSNTGQTTPEEMLFVNSATFEGQQGGLAFGGTGDHHTRRAWMITCRTQPNQPLVWFSGWNQDRKFVDDTVKYDDHNNLYPDVTRCHSSTFLHVSNALEAIENFVLKGVLPMHAMPPGHLSSLTG